MSLATGMMLFEVSLVQLKEFNFYAQVLPANEQIKVGAESGDNTRFANAKKQKEMAGSFPTPAYTAYDGGKNSGDISFYWVFYLVATVYWMNAYCIYNRYVQKYLPIGRRQAPSNWGVLGRIFSSNQRFESAV